ncbi:cysteine--tRNA ligase [Candidatus Parcubacteria bacterium]|nr:cysteine--tRNA ligase [Candidatus Parcubacteria bacterium]
MIKLYNTLTRKKEIFKPFKKGGINMFVCGITSYDFAHLGHAKTYLTFDLIAKYLKESGFKVFYLQNITDIDDKIIKRAQENRITPKKLAQNFEKEYFRDIKNLKITSVTKYARATEYIKEIISQVERLLKRDFAYKSKDGIYYDISKFKDYGKLAGRTVIQAEDGVSRIDDSIGKRNKGDFCLWKFSKKGEPRWKSPFGEGRPGWHIEDTAITEKYFGPQYDIHGGGRDLIFPHHEAEIAQMEAISGKKPLVKYWLHVGFLTVNGQKMSKSLGNFITIKDFIQKYDARLLRFFFVKNHYRSPIDYNEKAILQAKNELEKIDEFLERLKNQKRNKTKKSKEIKNLILETKKELRSALNDDFNTPITIASIFNLINQGNKLLDKSKLGYKDSKDIFGLLKEIDIIFGFIFWLKKTKKIPKALLELVKDREIARKNKNWQKADELRGKIENKGYIVEDTAKGPKAKKFKKKEPG